MCDITNILRSALDIAIQQPSILGLNPYKVWLVTITNSVVDVFGNGGTRVRADYRLTIGPTGFDSGLTGASGSQGFQDGYINPCIRQVSAKDIFLSGGMLTDKDFRLGPIVYSYTACSTDLPAGQDILLTNPAVESEQNLQLFFKLNGPAFPNDSYFKRIWSREDSNLAYYVYLRNTGDIVPI